MVVSGAGAAALACVDLLLDLGLARENVWLTDLAGVVYEGRQELMDPEKSRFAQPTDARTLARSSAVRTCSSACPPAACSPRTW